jgi:hypothetical protein
MFPKTLLALALMLGFGAALPGIAKADPDHGHRDHRAWDRHVHDTWAYRHAHPVYAPGYVYAPPAVVYAPPPPPPSGISLILPINIR